MNRPTHACWRAALTLALTYTVSIFADSVTEETFEADHSIGFTAEELPRPVPTPIQLESQIVSDLWRPWAQETPLGPTAFVLDRKGLQFGFDIDNTFGQLIPALMIGARFGIADQFTGGVFTSSEYRSNGRFIGGDVKWNAANNGPWSHSLRARAGSDKYSGTLLLEWTSSDVLDDTSRLHWTFAAGGGVGSSNALISARMLYEVRFAQRHSLTLGIGPQVRRSESYSYYSYSRWEQTEAGLLAGVGYAFFPGKLGLSIGIQGGPTISSGSGNFRIGMLSGGIALDLHFDKLGS